MFDLERSGHAELNMVTIATFNEAAKAKWLKERLQEAGIRADVHNEGHLQQVAFMSKAAGK